MKYIKVEWIHSFPEEPIIIYSELNEDRFELRKIEIFFDGSIGYATNDKCFAGTILSVLPIPEIQEIAADPQFKPNHISQMQFNEIWMEKVGIL